MNIFNISGGRTSAYMTIKHYKQGDIAIFCDTGREHSGTYIFLDKIEKNEGIEIVRLQYDGGFDQMIQNKKAIPNFHKRFCTVELKVMTTRRYLKSINIKSYRNFIGFRYDEPRRWKDKQSKWKKVELCLPLVDARITKSDILKYWENKSYNLDIPEILGNCDACFMKGKNAIISIYKEFPEIAQKWIEDEQKMGNTYFKDVSHAQLLAAAGASQKQYNLFDAKPEFKCACSNEL